MAETTSFHLRLPKSLYKRLQRQAKRNNVSLNTEIVSQLEGYEAETIRKIIETTQPYHAEAMRAAVTGATAGTMALIANFVQAFVAAGEQEPLTSEDIRWRERMVKAFHIFHDLEGLRQAGREMRAAQESGKAPSEEPVPEQE